MKKINLITSLSPAKQYEISRWFLITITLFLSICIIGSYYIISPFLAYRTIKQDCMTLKSKINGNAADTNAKNALKKEYDELYARTNKINAYKHQKKNPYLHITEIINACQSSMQVESLRCNKKDVEMTLLCPTAAHAQTLVKQLNASSHFSHVKMISFQQDEQQKQFRCTIKGNIIF